MLLVWPGAPFVASLLLVVMPGASSSFLLLVAMEGPFNATRWIECLRFGLEALLEFQNSCTEIKEMGAASSSKMNEPVSRRRPNYDNRKRSFFASSRQPKTIESLNIIRPLLHVQCFVCLVSCSLAPAFHLFILGEASMLHPRSD